MKVKSNIAGQEWLEEHARTAEEGAGDPQVVDGADPARKEIMRVLFDIVHTQNLIVLAGPGTSLCLKNEAGETRAPTMNALWQAVQRECISEEAGFFSWTDILRIAKHPEGNENIEELLARCKAAEVFETGDDQRRIQEFVAHAERIIGAEFDFLEDHEDLSSHTAFLRRLARRSNRRARLKLFTTNYDRCFEHAAQNSGFVIMDGFTPSHPSIFDPMYFGYDIVRRGVEADAPDFIENLFQLYKIHGSIDWEFDKKARRIKKVRNTDKPLLVYSGSTTLEPAFAPPYSEMMSSFQTAIRQRDVGLVVVGYDFNDSHIAESILATIKTNLAMKVVIISSGVDERSNFNPYLRKICKLIDQGDSRISLIDAEFEEIVPILPDATAMTELERHAKRMRAIGEE
jgi:hypothetical protein